MQNSYNATRVKIWNLFLLSKNFMAKNFEVKKIRASATRALGDNQHNLDALFGDRTSLSLLCRHCLFIVMVTQRSPLPG